MYSPYLQSLISAIPTTKIMYEETFGLRSWDNSQLLPDASTILKNNNDGVKSRVRARFLGTQLLTHNWVGSWVSSWGLPHTPTSNSITTLHRHTHTHTHTLHYPHTLTHTTLHTHLHTHTTYCLDLHVTQTRTEDEEHSFDRKEGVRQYIFLFIGVITLLVMKWQLLLTFVLRLSVPGMFP